MSFGDTFGTVITDLAGASQVGLGIYNESQGGPAINTNVGQYGTTPGSVAPTTTLFGFSIAEIFIGVLLIAGIGVAVYFATK